VRKPRFTHGLIKYMESIHPQFEFAHEPEAYVVPEELARVLMDHYTQTIERWDRRVLNR
jgi:hypothetical protein